MDHRPSMHAAVLERARDFLARQGSRLDFLRLEALCGLREPGDVCAALESLQHRDGCFAPLPRRVPPGPVRATLEALWALAELRVRRAASLEGAAGFLAAVQGDDGSWCDAEGVSEARRVAVTGFVGGVLAGSVYARPEVLEAAGAFLDAHWSPQLVEGGAWENLAALCAFFSNVAHERADEVLQRCGRELERGFRTGVFSGVRTARVLTLCDAVAMPGAGLDPGELVASILAEQDDDGGWPPSPGDDPAARAGATLDAALALARLPS
jgi:hypothetical protein